jgi:hypothetical protein
VVEDHQSDSRTAHFDVRYGSEGMYDLMRWLVQKVRAHEAKVARRQRKSSHRAGLAAAKESPVRQRLAVQVLIRNAVCIFFVHPKLRLCLQSHPLGTS